MLELKQQDFDAVEHWMDECFRLSGEKGWNDVEREFGTELMLAVSELSEALEEYRNGKPLRAIYYSNAHTSAKSRDSPLKPEGVAAELADALIRVFDTCRRHGIPLTRALKEKMSYNWTRAYRHGGKRC